MGEKKEGKGGDEKEKKAEAAAGEKNNDVILKVDVHCEGCAHKIKRAVKGFDGVESVKVDVGGDKVTASGAKIDAAALRNYLEVKTRKKVELISPKNPPPAAAGKDNDGGKKDSGEGKKDKPADGDKKPKAPQASTVVLKLRLHCEGCIQRIRKSISKVKGVEQVSVDAQKDLVTVKGTMDAKSLPTLLKDKFKRSVEIVPPKNDANGAAGGGGGGGGDKKEKDKGGDGGGEKKDKGGDGGGEKKDQGGDGGKEKEKEKGGGGGEKKEKEKENKEDGGKPQPQPQPQPQVEVSKMDYYGGYASYGYHGYQVEMAHAPQIFSDENPNACSVM